jgi:hypothetical protein
MAKYGVCIRLAVTVNTRSLGNGMTTRYRKSTSIDKPQLESTYTQCVIIVATC